MKTLLILLLLSPPIYAKDLYSVQNLQGDKIILTDLKCNAISTYLIYTKLDNKLFLGCYFIVKGNVYITWQDERRTTLQLNNFKRIFNT